MWVLLSADREIMIQGTLGIDNGIWRSRLPSLKNANVPVYNHDHAFPQIHIGSQDPQRRNYSRPTLCARKSAAGAG